MKLVPPLAAGNWCAPGWVEGIPRLKCSWPSFLCTPRNIPDAQRRYASALTSHVCAHLRANTGHLGTDVEVVCLRKFQGKSVHPGVEEQWKHSGVMSVYFAPL